MHIFMEEIGVKAINESWHNKNFWSLCKARYKQVITDAHFAAFILNPSIFVFNSNQEKKKKREKWSYKRWEKEGSRFYKRKMRLWFLSNYFKVFREDKTISQWINFFDPTIVKTMFEWE